VKFDSVEPLQYRRQFIITRAAIPSLAGWKHVALAGFHVYAHPDLETHSACNDERGIVLLGYLFDSANPKRSSEDIVNAMVRDSASTQQLLDTVKSYAGRYAIIFKDADELVIFSDSLGLREVYYCSDKHNVVVCGSQPNLLASFSDPKIKPSSNSQLMHFYEHEYKERKWIGEDTYFATVKHLLPNHLLSLSRLAARRYWPNAPVPRVALGDGVDAICGFLQAMMDAVTQRHRVMLAITAGTDSRTLVASSRKVRDKVYYFVNDHRRSPTHPDIHVPKAMCEAVGLPFHIHDVSASVDPKFKEIFFANVFQAGERLLPTIYNVYFKQHSDKVNVLGIGEIGRSRYGKKPKVLNGHRMAWALGYPGSDYVISQCERILPELSSTAARFGVNPMTLLYWEQMLGNWGAVGNSESDIAIEEFNPFASHALYELFLGVDERYTTYSNSVLFREIIKKQWPELLAWPINPPGSKVDTVKTLLKKGLLFGLLKECKYQLGYVRYRAARVLRTA
jgi:hypothetical protein